MTSPVYKINCRDCDSSDVGETGRALKTHMLEHRRAVEKMDFSASALVQHALEHDHHINWTSMCVLGVESHYRSRLSTAVGSPLFSIGRGTLPDNRPKWIGYRSHKMQPMLRSVTSLPVMF